MAITDIPEFVNANPGDLITAKAWDSVQQMMRSSLRLHQHDRLAGTLPTDTDTVDHAEQIGTNEIADGSVTTAKLATGAVTSANIPDGAIGSAQIANLAVGTANLANASVTSAKLSFATVGQIMSFSVGANGLSQDILVQAGLTGSKTVIYFVSLTITSTAGVAGTFSQITAQIEYRQTTGTNTIDLWVHFTNTGSAPASGFFAVHTFA
jgi:hypothetical protein